MNIQEFDFVIVDYLMENLFMDIVYWRNDFLKEIVSFEDEIYFYQGGYFFIRGIL